MEIKVLGTGCAGCNLRRTDVCQRCGYCPCDSGICCQGHSPRNGHRLHDGCRRIVAARSHDAQKGDDMAVGRDFLWCGDAVHRVVGVSVQYHSVTKWDLCGCISAAAGSCVCRIRARTAAERPDMAD